MKTAPFPSLSQEDHRDGEGHTAAGSRTQDLNYYPQCGLCLHSFA